jgi:hypothetical protein
VSLYSVDGFATIYYTDWSLEKHELHSNKILIIISPDIRTYSLAVSDEIPNGENIRNLYLLQKLASSPMAYAEMQ